MASTRAIRNLTEVFTLVVPILLMFLSSRAVLAADDDGFLPLFDGKDLSGWVNVNCAPSTFTVRDGQIITTGIPTGVLRTDRQYENFILELDWKHIVPGGNSGLFVWSDAITAPGQPFTRAFECQILDGHETPNSTSNGDVFAIHGSFFVPDRPHPAGWMRCLPNEKRSKPAGQWNHYRVECNDGVLKLAVNGKVVSGGSKARPRKGYICLEAEGSECHFRNIRIKELPSTNPKPDEVARLDEGFKSLYTGVDLSGWNVDPTDAGHWQPKDWILAYDGKGVAGKSLSSEKEFGDCQIIVDWRLPANSKATAGILLRGDPKARVDIGTASTGSGGISRYAGESNISEPVRTALTPKIRADAKPGTWNRFIITLKGDRVRVELNGKPVIEGAQLPGLTPRGCLALQHDAGPIQFANIYIRDLRPGDH